MLLTQVGSLSNTTVFSICTIWLVAAQLAMLQFERIQVSTLKREQDTEQQQPTLIE